LHIRNKEEFFAEQERVGGEMEISINDLEQRLDELADYIERPIALFSGSEKLTWKAGEILASNGFAHVRIIQGSIADLRR